jgi:NAD(P)-dependent dehydrogenase (short-subunit alcohol dehydrogenase family)
MMALAGSTLTLSAGRSRVDEELDMERKFNAQSTVEEVLQGYDLVGKRILVTGVSSGLGAQTARTLAAHGAYVVGAARDLRKARAAMEGAYKQGAADRRPELVQLDLASLSSVRQCTDRLLSTGNPFDLVIANAGVMASPKGKTVDGFETQFATNHLGHFLLVNRIASLIREGGRLVNLSSSGHRFSDVDLEDPNFEHTPYDEFNAYGRSKTANVLFTVEFDRRHKMRSVRAAAVHPGGIRTQLARHMTTGLLESLVDQMNATRRGDDSEFKWKSLSQGAATSVWAGVVAPAELVGGRYCEDCDVAEINDVDSAVSVRGGVRSYALDPVRAKALWAKSEEMVGERFDPPSG